jgi:hypothetical protein
MNLKDYRSGPVKVSGSTTINHSARMQLEISCSEYVFIDALHRIKAKGETLSVEAMYLLTGFNAEEQQKLISLAAQKGFLYPLSDIREVTKINLTSKFGDAFGDREKEFDKFFWKDKSGKTAWPGSRKKALELYIKVRKEYDREYIMRQRDEYFAYLDVVRKTGFDRQKMMATVFLGPQERFNEDWKAQYDEAFKKLKRNQVEMERREREGIRPITEEERRNLYRG